MATISIPHTVTLVTELDDANPTAKRLLAMPEEQLHKLLADVFTSIMSERKWFDVMNENNTYATVRLPKYGEVNG